MTKVVWKPLPGSQQMVLSCRCNEILNDGTRGAAKTDAQLMYFRQFVGMGYGKFLRGILLDTDYKALDDIVARSLKYFPLMGDGALFKMAKGDYRWTWPTGEELLFRQMKTPEQYYKYHGHEYPLIFWNELTKLPTKECYELMLSCNRSSYIPEENPIYVDKEAHDKHGVIMLLEEEAEGSKKIILPDIPLTTLSTTNPFGVGHPWVKRKFIDPSPPGVIQRETHRIYDPKLKKEVDHETTRVRIFSSYRENTYLPRRYIAALSSIDDDNLRKAWEKGSWDISSGAAFDDLWNGRHVMKPFPIPEGWFIDRSFDWGSTRPFSVGWWAESNGEEVEIEGKKVAFPKGTLFRIAEWYGTSKVGTNKGLKMPSASIAKGILLKEMNMLESGLINKKPIGGPADNSIFDDTPDSESIATIMEGEGVYWSKSNKSPGSRSNGFILVRERLANTISGEGAGLYIFNNCKAFIELFPQLEREDPFIDDVNTVLEDHFYDELRYRVLDSSSIVSKVNIKKPY